MDFRTLGLATYYHHVLKSFKTSDTTQKTDRVINTLTRYDLTLDFIEDDLDEINQLINLPTDVLRAFKAQQQDGATVLHYAVITDTVIIPEKKPEPQKVHCPMAPKSLPQRHNVTKANLLKERIGEINEQREKERLRRACPPTAPPMDTHRGDPPASTTTVGGTPLQKFPTRAGVTTPFCPRSRTGDLHAVLQPSQHASRTPSPTVRPTLSSVRSRTVTVTVGDHTFRT